MKSTGNQKKLKSFFKSSEEKMEPEPINIINLISNEDDNVVFIKSNENSKQKWNDIFSKKPSKRGVEKVEETVEDVISLKFIESVRKKQMTSTENVNSISNPFFLKKEKMVKTEKTLNNNRYDLDIEINFPMLQHLGQSINENNVSPRVKKRLKKKYEPLVKFVYPLNDDINLHDVSFSILCDLNSKKNMNYRLTVENDITLVCSKQNSSVEFRALWTNYAESFSNMISPRLEGDENSEVFLQKRDSIRYEIYNWLKTWYTNGQIIKPLGQGKSKSASASANNKFNNYTDDSSSDDEKEPNIFVIEGSYSSGKTTLVHSFGVENDINIIEINSGQLRSGTTIKKLISEATQSYGINHLNKENNFGGVSMIFFDEVFIIYMLFTMQSNK